jgi:hypothetical protein
MAVEYSREDAEKVLQHLYKTLTATIDFFFTLEIENPNLRPKGVNYVDAGRGAFRRQE